MMSVSMQNSTTIGENTQSKFELPEAAMAAIIRGIERGDCVVEMEALEIPQRTINALEYSDFKIVKLKDLMYARREDLYSIPNLGEKSLEDLFKALARYDELEKILLADEQE